MLETDIEDCIRRMVIGALRSPIHRGTIKCDASIGYMGMAGSFQRSKGSTTSDLLELLPQDFEDPDKDFTSLIERLHKASCENPESAPWYRCNIEVEGRHCSFRYWREDPSVSDLSLLEPTIDGSTPLFPFRNQFSLALLRQLKLSDYESAFLEFVPRALRDRTELPSALFGYFALTDWQADTNNGSLDQYFARPIDWLGAEIERTHLYPEVRATLERLGMTTASELFEEAMALYAHFHERVDESREAMGIAAVPKHTESDIMARYYEMLDDIESRQWSYFGQHLTEFAVG